MAANLGLTGFLAIVMMVGLCLNGFLIFNFIRRRRLRTIMTGPACILYVFLAVVDILAMLLWTLHTALSASAGKWTLSSAFCDQQVYIRVFCNMANVLTLMVFMAERVLRIFKPSKHREIFFDVVVLLLILGVCIFVGTLASFPLWGWGLVKYFDKEYQCAIGFEESPSYYDFSISMGLGIPAGLILVGYIAILIRVQLLKRKRGPKGVIVLEEDFEVIGDSYSDRLKKLYESYKDPEKKLFSKSSSDNSPFDDTSYLDSDCFDSDEDPDEKDADGKTGDDDEEDGGKSWRMPPRKCYHLGKNDVPQAHMYALMAAVYFVLWIPNYVRFYQDTYQYFETTPSDNFILAAVVLTHLGSVFKPPIYLLSYTVRGAVKKTLGIGQDGKRKKRRKTPKAGEEQT